MSALLDRRGQCYFSDNNQTVIITGAGIDTPINLIQTLDPLSNGWSMPVNGELQNDTGSNLLCHVQLNMTVRADTGTRNYEFLLGRYDGSYSVVTNTEQSRRGFSTVFRSKAVSGEFTINDGERVLGFVRNPDNGVDLDVVNYCLQVIPIKVA